MLLLGNLTSLIASLVFFSSSIAKSKKSMLRLQIVETIISTISCLMLGGMSGTLVNFIAFVRNTLAYKDRTSKLLTTVIVSSLIGINTLTNTEGMLGWLPIVASAEYTICMMIPEVSHKILRISLFLNVVLWVVYSWSISDYVSVATFAIVLLGMMVRRT